MKKSLKFLLKVTTIAKWTGIVAIVIMMFFITAGVIMRRLGSPLLGSVEIVQLLMVIAIMGGLSYCESQNGHISVDLIFERFSPKVQSILIGISKVISLAVILMVAIVFYNVSMNSLAGAGRSTDLLGIPFYPFEIVISIGFLAWFIQIAIPMLINEGSKENEHVQ